MNKTEREILEEVQELIDAIKDKQESIDLLVIDIENIITSIVDTDTNYRLTHNLSFV